MHRKTRRVRIHRRALHIYDFLIISKEPLLIYTRAHRAHKQALYIHERWGAGVETHFQEISWNLRHVVNGT